MDRTVVVTGATRGIGRAVAESFADAGALVVACARDADALAALPEAIVTQRADVRDEFDMERLMETAAREGGPIDVLVANAGVYHGEAGHTPITEEAYAAWDDHMRTNGRGVFAAIKEAVPHLAEDARIVVPSGRIAREAKPGFGTYAVSKALAEATARQFAADLAVPVGVVDPGMVTSELTDGMQGRAPEEVADLFVWAATDAPAEELDGGVIDLKTWKRATR